jgi:hypothetical protein
MTDQERYLLGLGHRWGRLLTALQSATDTLKLGFNEKNLLTPYLEREMIDIAERLTALEQKAWALEAKCAGDKK